MPREFPPHADPLMIGRWRVLCVFRVSSVCSSVILACQELVSDMFFWFCFVLFPFHVLHDVVLCVGSNCIRAEVRDSEQYQFNINFNINIKVHFNSTQPAQLHFDCPTPDIQPGIDVYRHNGTIVPITSPDQDPALTRTSPFSISTENLVV